MVAKDFKVATVLVQQKRQIGHRIGKGLQLGFPAHQGPGGLLSQLVRAPDQGQQHAGHQGHDGHVDQIDAFLAIGFLLQHGLPGACGFGGGLGDRLHGGHQLWFGHRFGVLQSLVQ